MSKYKTPMPRTICNYTDEKCSIPAKFGYPIAGSNQNPERCSDHKEKDMKNIYKQTFCPCIKTANFGKPDGKRICCSKCKKDNMIDLSHSRCFCKKAFPSFNFEGNKPRYCLLCKEEGMISVSGIKCKCKKIANFGYIGEKPFCCSICKKDDMVDLRHKKCLCKKAFPSFNYNGKKPICCFLCKKDGMINVIGKRCICGIRPIFGYKKDGINLCCSQCKTEDMIDLRHIKCVCGTRPSFGLQDDEKASCCSQCKTEGMIDIVNRKCKCGTIPTFAFSNNEKNLYCNTCKLDEMINIRNKQCQSNEIYNTGCITRANIKYDNYCTHCFSNLFPNDERTSLIRKKSKEIATVNYVSTKIDGFYNDKPLYVNLSDNQCDCTSKRRIDLRKLIGNTMLCIEVDENQHRGYCKLDEEKRYNELVMDFTGKYIFIRFNPDEYKDKNRKIKNPKLNERFPVLLKEILKHITRIENDKNEDLLEIHHLFYDIK